MTKAQELELQLWLIKLKEFTQTRPDFVPKEASFHIAPDSVWCALEHEYTEQELPNAQSPHDFCIVIQRKPPSCHVILAKI